MTIQDLFQYVTYVAIGLTIGSVSGVLGIGGGVLIVPALMWVCGFDPKKAVGTSLAILIPPIGLPAALEAYRRDYVDLSAALWIAGSFMIGAYSSRLLVDYIPVAWFRLAFGLIMIFVAMRFILHSDSEAASAAAGIVAAVLAWLGYLGLKWLGKRHLPPPKLGEQIVKKHDENPGGPDYHI
jgi:uncharacterized membrane protein YfcA